MVHFCWIHPSDKSVFYSTNSIIKSLPRVLSDQNTTSYYFQKFSYFFSKELAKTILDNIRKILKMIFQMILDLITFTASQSNLFSP
jgi:hypothetical protein